MESQTLLAFDPGPQRGPASVRQIEAQTKAVRRELESVAPRRVVPNANSIAAYRALPLSEMQQAVLHVAFDFKAGFTHDELIAAMPHYKPSSVRGRCAELVKLGSIVKVGRRELENGNHSTVWKVR
jgi:hypothetical protein